MSHNILIRPYLTEKTLPQEKSPRFTFLVDRTATKHQIKKTLKDLYNVDVVKITTTTHPRLTSRSLRTGRYQTQTSYKKATILLKDKQTLPIFKTTSQTTKK